MEYLSLTNRPDEPVFVVDPVPPIDQHEQIPCFSHTVALTGYYPELGYIESHDYWTPTFLAETYRHWVEQGVKHIQLVWRTGPKAPQRVFGWDTAIELDIAARRNLEAAE